MPRLQRPLRWCFSDVLRSLTASVAPSSIEIRPVRFSGGGIADVLHLQPDGPHSTYRCRARASYVLARGLLLSMAGRGLERPLICGEDTPFAPADLERFADT